MFADHRIGCERQAEFLQSYSTCLLWQIADAGLCEKTVENHVLKGRSLNGCRNGSGEQARAPCGNRDRDLGQRVVIEQRDLSLGGGVDERKKLPGIYRS